MNDEIRERHGVLTLQGTQAASINEMDDCLRLTITSGGTTKTIEITPDEARYLASKLRRVAWRVECRL